MVCSGEKLFRCFLFVVYMVCDFFRRAVDPAHCSSCTVSGFLHLAEMGHFECDFRMMTTTLMDLSPSHAQQHAFLSGLPSVWLCRWQSFGSGNPKGCSMRRGKAAPCSTQPAPKSLLQCTAGPQSLGNTTLRKMYLRAKNAAERNVKNRPLDTRVREGGEGGGTPGTEAKVPLQPAEKWSRLFPYSPWGHHMEYTDYHMEPMVEQVGLGCNPCRC